MHQIENVVFFALEDLGYPVTEMNVEGKMNAGKKSRKLLKLSDKIHDLPFLAIESDGNRFPQIITAKLEAFLLQAGRLHDELR